MAPIKSSLAKSAKKLIGFFNTADLGLRGATQKTRKLPGAVSSGGSILAPGDGYRYHVFTGGPQTFSITQLRDPLTLDILVIAGGGGGAGGSTSGGAAGGGGGAGGLVFYPNFPVTASLTADVNCGDGGNGAAAGGGYGSGGYGVQGTDTTFGTSPQPHYLIAKGGGYGKSYPEAGGNPGGSGGGGAWVPTSAATATQPTQPGNSGTYGFGNNGGVAEPNYNTGGGGGAGSIGSSGSSTKAGNGGNGKPISIFPAPVIAPAIPAPVRSAWTTAVGPTGLFCGGGGGGTYNGTIGSGGPGGGGDGSPWTNDPDGVPGGVPAIDFTGSGGGGGIGGGDGGNGIVLCRLPAPAFE